MGGLSLSVFALLKMKTETAKDLGINSFAITVISLKDVFWGNDLSPAARRGPVYLFVTLLGVASWRQLGPHGVCLQSVAICCCVGNVRRK